MGSIGRIVARVAVAGTLAAGVWVGMAAAQSWPTKPIRIIVPFAPGGAADTSARVLGDIIGPQIGQAIVVENRPGAGSAIGVAAAAQARDGHTLLMGSNSMVINPHLMPNISYDVARDFDAVGMVSAQPLVLVVPAESPVKSVTDFLADAKANPGKYTAGNSGTGTLAHLTSVLFEQQTGARITSVPYKGESALLPDLVSGQINVGILNLPSVLPLIKAGKLRALAVTARETVADLPGVPTFRSAGLPELEVEGWAALLAPKGAIPPDGLERLAKLLNGALASDAIKARFGAIGIAPVSAGMAATTANLAREGAQWKALIAARGIKADQ